MWALGISVIEMAEVVPPRWKVRVSASGSRAAPERKPKTTLRDKDMRSSQQPLALAVFGTSVEAFQHHFCS